MQFLPLGSQAIIYTTSDQIPVRRTSNLGQDHASKGERAIASRLSPIKSASFMIGQILDGRYRVTDVLSKGGFGHTFRAQDTKRPGSPICVVKQLKPAFSDPNMLEIAHKLFEREAEILEKLGNHPQIPRLLAYFEENSEFYLVQEYIDGPTLDRELVPNTILAENNVINVLIEVLEILEFVHGHSVIHRDIKPENIIRSRENNRLFLIDFGAVKQVINNQNKQVTAIGTVIGTPPYITLEVFQGQPKFSSDIYALGMIGIKALTGTQLEPHMGGGFEQDTQGKLLWRDRAIVSNELAEILTKMVHQDYRQRYQSAREVLEDLRRLQLMRGIAQPNPQLYQTAPQSGHYTAIQGKKPEDTVISTLPNETSSSVGVGTFIPSKNSNNKLLIGLGVAAVVLLSGGFAIWKLIPTSSSFPELALDGNFTEGILTPSNACNDIPQASIFCQKYTFKGQKGQKVTIEMNSEEFDPQLVLLKPDGEQLDINSDIAPNNQNAKLTVSLPSDGNYTLIARTSFSGELGKYAIKAAAQ
jgi:serine/threonine protein kinase